MRSIVPVVAGCGQLGHIGPCKKGPCFNNVCQENCQAEAFRDRSADHFAPIGCWTVTKGIKLMMILTCIVITLSFFYGGPCQTGAMESFSEANSE